MVAQSQRGYSRQRITLPSSFVLSSRLKKLRRFKVPQNRFSHPKEERGKLGTDLDYDHDWLFLSMILIGTWFGRGQSSTKDFFFGGQRFSWWLIAFSLVATTIGSSSFVKYSKIAYSYGIASSQTYMNDWFWVPLLLFGWLPILLLLQSHQYP